MKRRHIPLYVVVGAAFVLILLLWVLTHHHEQAAAPATKISKTAPKPAAPVVQPASMAVGVVTGVGAGDILRPGLLGPVRADGSGFGAPPHALPNISKPGSVKPVPAQGAPSAVPALGLPTVDRTPASRADVPGSVEFSVKAEDHFYGAMLRHDMSPGTPLTPADVLFPGTRGFLDAVLHPGQQAVTIPVNAITDSSGLLWPGDHVDVLLVQSLPAQREPGLNIAAERVLSDVEVIAAGSSLLHSSYGNAQAALPVSAVTLAVTPRQAKHLLLAENLGGLDLSILSSRTKTAPTDSIAAGSGPTWAYQVSPAIRDRDFNSVTVFTGTAQQGYSVP